jgi:polar amino acid transport system substrate-binding protein
MDRTVLKIRNPAASRGTFPAIPRRISRMVIRLLILVATIPAPLAAQSALEWNQTERAEFDRLPSIVVATDSTWPPMEYINRERQLVGFDIDLLREVGLRAGFRPDFITVAWDGIFAGLAAGQYEIIASSVTLLEERRATMLFSDPYFTAAQYLLVPAEAAEVNEISDLAGGSVGAQIATTGARIVSETPGVSLRSYDDLGLAVEDLAAGRLAGVVADTAIVHYFVLSNPRYREMLRVAARPYAVEEYAFAIHPDREDLRNAINVALREISADGTLRRIRDFWFDELPE